MSDESRKPPMLLVRETLINKAEDLHLLAGFIRDGRPRPDARPLADELDEIGDILAWCAEGTKRRPYVRKSKPRQQGPDEATSQAIREYAAAHPEASEWEIGQVFNLNQGRISERLAGKRNP